MYYNRSLNITSNIVVNVYINLGRMHNFSKRSKVTQILRVSLILILVYISNLLVTLSTFHTNDGTLENQFRLKKEHLKVNNREADTSPSLTIPNNNWRKAPGSENSQLFLFSAYLDLRNEETPLIRIFSLSKNELQNVVCIYWSSPTDNFLLKGELFVFYDYGQPFTHSASSVLCPVYNPQTPPIRIGVSINESIVGSYEDALPLQHLTGRQYEAQMNACVGAFWNNFNRVAQVVEFIEMYKILGVSKFIFYNDSISDETNLLLKYYIEEGTVELYPYTLPVVNNVNIYVEAIQSAMNDCAYRSIGRFNLTVMVDVDEILMPHEDISLIELTRRLGYYDAYAFKNVFFYQHLPRNTTVYNPSSYTASTAEELFSGGKIPPPLLSQMFFLRVAEPNEYHYRSKYIVRPDRASILNLHYLVKSVGEQSIKVLPEDVGLSFHYRECEEDLETCNNKNYKTDNTTLRYTVKLLGNAKRVCKTVFPDRQTCSGNYDFV